MSRASCLLLVASLSPCIGFEPALAQSLDFGVAAIHVAPGELDGALGMECCLQLGPAGAPFALLGSYRFVRRVAEFSGMTCGSGWPTWDGCLIEILHQEAAMSTWMCGVLFESPQSRRVRLGIGVGLEVSRVQASRQGETTGRHEGGLYSGTLGALAILGRGSFRPNQSLPLELTVTLRAETTSFGGRCMDCGWGLSRANGVLGVSIGAGYSFQG